MGIIASFDIFLHTAAAYQFVTQKKKQLKPPIKREPLLQNPLWPFLHFMCLCAVFVRVFDFKVLSDVAS